MQSSLASFDIPDYSPFLNSSKHLSKAQKDAIRSYILEAHDEDDKKRRKEKMMKEYHITEGVVNALVAWTKIWDEKWNKRSDHTIQIVSPMVSQILDSTPPTNTVSEPEKDNTHESNDTDHAYSLETLSVEDIDFIADFFSTCDWEDKTEIEEYEASIIDIFPGLTITDITKLIQRDNIQERGEGMGALVNYDNAIKNKWRQTLKEFIDENTDSEKRKDMKVLCLPGMECREIPLYLELGFCPENIVGVEAGIVKGKINAEVIRKFKENAEKYGIQTRIEKLEKILEKEDMTFDVVSLDFLGPWSDWYQKILESINFNSRFIVMTNIQWRREKSFHKIWEFHKKITSPVDMTLLQFNNTNISSEALFSQESCQNDITMAREDLALSNIISNYIVGGVDTESKFYTKIQPSLHNIINKLEIGSDISQKEREHMAFRSIDVYLNLITLCIFDEYGDDTIVTSTMGTLFILMGLLDSKINVCTHKGYKYKWHKGTPMLTDCFSFEKRENEDFSIFLPFIRFISAILKNISDDEGGFFIQRKLLYSRSLWDEICLRRWTLILAKISFWQIFAMKNNWQKKYPKNTISSYSDRERIE